MIGTALFWFLITFATVVNVALILRARVHARHARRWLGEVQNVAARVGVVTAFVGIPRHPRKPCAVTYHIDPDGPSTDFPCQLPMGHVGPHLINPEHVKRANYSYPPF